MTNFDSFVHPYALHTLILMLYVGPDQMLPVLSFIGAIIGFLLMTWQRLVLLVRRALKFLTRKEEVTTKSK